MLTLILLTPLLSVGAFFLYWWYGIQVGGMVVTNVSVFCGWSQILSQLCPLWLVLCGFGYLGTVWALRSRSLILGAAFHFLSILILPLVSQWQYLITGLIMTGTLLLFSDRRWDMRTR